jgi:5'-3' exoribonuclease 2
MIHDVVEDEPYDVNGVEVPIDTSQPNPNGRECAPAARRRERSATQRAKTAARSRRIASARAAGADALASSRFDNLYLDMNGIIHPCFHPEDRVRPRSSAAQRSLAQP